MSELWCFYMTYQPNGSRAKLKYDCMLSKNSTLQLYCESSKNNHTSHVTLNTSLSFCLLLWTKYDYLMSLRRKWHVGLHVGIELKDKEW